MKIRATALTIIAALAITGCAKQYAGSDAEKIQSLFDAWIEYYYGKPLEDGTYQEGRTGLRATPLGDKGVMLLGEETIGDGDAWDASQRWVKVNYTITDLQGYVQATTYEKTARRVGYYQAGNYYGPRVWYMQDGSVGTYAGLEDAVAGMKIGGRRKVAIPSWLITTDRYGTKEEYLKVADSAVSSYIYEFELLGFSDDVFRTEIDSMEVYINKNFAAPYRDSVAYDQENGHKRGFYYETLSFGSPSEGSNYNMPADPANYEMPNDTVIYVNYTGRLLNGLVFDTTEADTAKVYNIYSTSKSYSPLAVVLTEKYTDITLAGSTTITGFSGALARLHPFEKARTCFYSILGYSYTGSGSSIPAYCPLIFDIQVVEQP
ncbi:MAG: FKBP-type peptidyl-prolyl cis-trans isomerase [Bacteroidales bacterium]|nr:FKBP-type peptidyl-prolyl cis-trans isomerase [Bacteroidales bacterium]